MNHWYNFQGVAGNRRHMCHDAVARHIMNSCYVNTKGYDMDA